MCENTSIIYRINAQDVIVFVNDDRDQSAHLNKAFDFISEDVLNQSLWNFITDATTRYIYREIISQVRLNKSITIKFRCDSPEYERHLEMNITLHEGDEVQFEVKTLKIEEHIPQRLIGRNVLHFDELVAICSWCKKIDAGQGNWKEIEEAITELGLFEKEKPPQLTHGICSNCYLKLSKQITEKSSNRN